MDILKESKMLRSDIQYRKTKKNLPGKQAGAASRGDQTARPGRQKKTISQEEHESNIPENKRKSSRFLSEVF